MTISAAGPLRTAPAVSPSVELSPVRLNNFLGDMFHQFPRPFVFNIVLLVLSGLLESLTLLTMIPVMDFLTLPSLANAGVVTRHFIAGMRRIGLATDLGHALGVLLVVQFVASAMAVLVSYSTLRTKYKVVQEIYLGTFRDFFQARWYFFSANSQGTLLSTFTGAANHVGDAFGNLAFFFVVMVRIFFLLTVPLTISWRITLLSAGLVAALVWPFFRMGKWVYRLGQINTRTDNDIMSVLNEGLTSAKVILGFGNEKKSEDDLQRSLEAHQQATIKFQTLTHATPSIFKPLGLAVLVLALWVSRRFGMPLSEMAVMMLALLQIIPLVASLTANKNLLRNLMPAYEQIKSLREDARRQRRCVGQREFLGFEKELVIENLTFAYPDRPPVLNGISLRIAKGQFVAIVGASGAGKSTLIDLLMALHEPSSGQIYFDGVPLQEFDVTSYRRRIGYVPQESVLFNRSIRDNLLWARDDATEEEIRSACRQASATEFIEKLPQGYDTIVGDRGVRFSGGQAQRLSLARAILRKPDLLILDEATSALDTHSERLVQQAIESIAHGTTVVAIAHRLSTIMSADHIVLLKEGQIAEQGTYSELVAQRKLFHEMVQLQMLRSVK